tara:strand:+ start:135 stop:269 length:135 start_codon:yes stop_codon:yes gene_type:complete
MKYKIEKKVDNLKEQKTVLLIKTDSILDAIFWSLVFRVKFIRDE